MSIILNLNISKNQKDPNLRDKIIGMALGIKDLKYGKPFELIDVRYVGKWHGSITGFEDAIIDYTNDGDENAEPVVSYRDGHATFEKNLMGQRWARIPRTEKNLKQLAVHWDYGCFYIKDDKVRDEVANIWKGIKAKMTPDEIKQFEEMVEDTKRTTLDGDFIPSQVQKQMLKPVIDDNTRLRQEKEDAEKAAFEATEKLRIMEEKLASMNLPKEEEKEIKKDIDSTFIPENIFEVETASLKNRDFNNLMEISTRMGLKIPGRKNADTLIRYIKAEIENHNKPREPEPVPA